MICGAAPSPNRKIPSSCVAVPSGNASDAFQPPWQNEESGTRFLFDGGVNKVRGIVLSVRIHLDSHILVPPAYGHGPDGEKWKLIVKNTIYMSLYFSLLKLFLSLVYGKNICCKQLEKPVFPRGRKETP